MSKNFLLQRPTICKSFSDEEAENGRWTYLYNIDGIHIDVPARIGKVEDVIEAAQEHGEKVIFWKSSEFKKYINDNVEKLSYDELPYKGLCLCMIEEADNFAKDKIFEVMKIQMNPDGSSVAEQWIYDEVENNEMADKYEFLEWIQLGQFNKGDASFFSHIGCIESNITIALKKNRWLETQARLNERTEEKKTVLLGLSTDHKDYDVDVKSAYEEFFKRAMVLFYAFNWYVYNLKPTVATYKTGRENVARPMEEWQDMQEKDRHVYVLKGGVTKTFATGEGGKHSHQYDVRSHQRVLADGKIITVKGYRRGEGDYIPKQSAISHQTAQQVMATSIREHPTIQRVKNGKMKEWLRGAYIFMVQLFRKLHLASDSPQV